MENVETLLCEMPGQTHQAAASPETIQVLKSLQAIQVLKSLQTIQVLKSLQTIQVLKSLQTIQVLKCIICKYNWIPDYTIIMLVHKLTWILQISRGLLANQNADSEYNV